MTREHSSVAPDREAIEEALALIVAPGDVVELRAMGVCFAGERYDKGQNRVGYYNDISALARDAAQLRKGGDVTSAGVYITVNPLNAGLLFRGKNKLLRARTAAGDTDVKRRRWLLVDCDAERMIDGVIYKDMPTDHAEHADACDVAHTIKSTMMGEGWPEPVFASSGNGAHLMWRIDEPNDDETLGVIKGVLAALKARFDVVGVDVDQTVCNAARIWKLYGTPSWKGEEDEASGRVHRRSEIYSAPDVLAAVTREQLEALAQEIDEPAAAAPTPIPPKASTPKPSRVMSASANVTLDIDEFVSSHLHVLRSGAWKGGGRKWVLASSPMCSHDGDGPFVGEQPNGAIVAGCHHNSCTWGWRDLRDHFDPESRERRERWEERQAAPRLRVVRPSSTVAVADVVAGGVAALRRVEDPIDEHGGLPEPTALPLPSSYWQERPSETRLARRLGEQLDGAGERVVYTQGRLWSYDAASGVWSAIADEDARCLVMSWDGESIGHSGKQVVDISGSASKSAVTMLQAMRAGEGRGFFDKAPRGFCVDGAFLRVDVERGEIVEEEISPRWRVTAALPCAFDASARGEYLDHYRSTIHAGQPDEADRLRLMGELLFVALSGLGPHYNKAALLYNKEGGSGKSVFIALLCGLVPEGLRSSIQPHEIGEDYKGAMLAGKRLNTVTECKEDSVMREAGFKAVISGEPTTRRQIRGEPFTFIPLALHVFAGNTLPPAPRATGAFWARWLVLHFANVFRDKSTEIKGLADLILKDEMAALVAWAVECGRELIKRGRYTIPASTESLFAKWRQESDNVAAWVEGELVEVMPENGERGDMALCGAAYKAYRTWCEENGYRRPVNSRNLARRLESLGVQRKRRSRAGFTYNLRLVPQIFGDSPY